MEGIGVKNLLLPSFQMISTTDTGIQLWSVDWIHTVCFIWEGLWRITSKFWNIAWCPLSHLIFYCKKGDEFPKAFINDWSVVAYVVNEKAWNFTYHLYIQVRKASFLTFTVLNFVVCYDFEAMMTDRKSVPMFKI